MDSESRQQITQDLFFQFRNLYGELEKDFNGRDFCSEDICIAYPMWDSNFIYNSIIYLANLKLLEVTKTISYHQYYKLFGTTLTEIEVQEDDSSTET